MRGAPPSPNVSAEMILSSPREAQCLQLDVSASAMQDDPLPTTTTLESLPVELIIAVARLCLAEHLPSAVRLATQTCQRLCASLQPVLADAAARRLRWLPSHTMRHSISSDGRTLTKSHANGHDCSLAASQLLPTTGKSAWRIRVEESCGRGHDLNNSSFIGVCDASGRSEWGLDLCEGTLIHLKRNHRGQIVELGDNRSSGPLSDSVCLRGSGSGSTIEIIVDHDKGTISFRVNEGPVTAPAIISSLSVDTVVDATAGAAMAKSTKYKLLHATAVREVWHCARVPLSDLPAAHPDE